MTVKTKKDAEIVDLRPTFRNADEHGIWANTYWDIWECDNVSDPVKLEAACRKAAAVADALILRLQQRTPKELNDAADANERIERTAERFVNAMTAAEDKKAEREALFRDAMLRLLRPVAEAMLKSYGVVKECTCPHGGANPGDHEPGPHHGSLCPLFVPAPLASALAYTIGMTGSGAGTRRGEETEK